MNRAETAEAAKVMAAFADGKQIDFRVKGGEWSDWASHNNFGWNWKECDYRIKPTPRTIPWTAETFPKDRPVWVRHGTSDVARLIADFSTPYVKVVGAGHIAWQELLSGYTQHDGTPCGTTEEG